MTAVVLGALALSGVALAVAPLLVPADYHWIAQTISESAGQGVPGAWMARTGLVLFGAAVLVIAYRSRRSWGRWPTILHSIFGGLLVMAAVFSHKPWRSDVPFDAVEDVLHSVAATMGFALVAGVLVLMLRPGRGAARWLDAVPIVASVALPLSMQATPGASGIAQRAMFLIAYVWYGTEVVRELRAHVGGRLEQQDLIPGRGRAPLRLRERAPTFE